MNWLAIGDSLVLEVRQAPEELTVAFGQDFAEHATIMGKPRLQWIGSKLRELKFRLVMHWWDADPEELLQQLLDLSDAHEPLALVFGDGAHGMPFSGSYVFTDTPVTVKQQADNGRMLLLEVDVTLREWAADLVIEMKPKPRGKAVGPKKPGAKQDGAAVTTTKTENGYTIREVTRQPAKK